MLAGLPYRLTLALLTISAAIFALPSHAQVTLHLATPQGDCVATTNAAGLSLGPDGTSLQAGGVTLSGSCGSQSQNFQPTISVSPANVQVGSDATVTWQGGPDATLCTYDGPRTGVDSTDWPAGDIACTGAACATSHTKPVTITAAGTYTFGLTCSNNTGLAQSNSVTASSGQNPFTLNVPATGSVGVPFSVTWTAPAGASACTGSSTGPDALAGWTGATNLTPPASVTADMAGTFTLTLTCTVSGLPVASAPATIVVGSDTCVNAQNRFTSATIKYPNYGGGTRAGVDLTRFDNIWGHLNATDGVTPWPGVNGAQPEILSWDRTKFIAAKFTVPVSAPAGMYGWLGVGTYYGQQMDLSISQTCGDFAPANPVCLTQDRGPGQNFNRWAIIPTNQCALTPGQDYYINLRLHDQTACAPSGVCSGILINSYFSG